MTIANSEILLHSKYLRQLMVRIKFGIVENSEANDTPSERCSSGNASIIPSL